MRARLTGDELHIDPEGGPDSADAALEHIAYAQLLTYCTDVPGLALVAVRGLTRDNEGVLNVREVAGKIIGNAIGQVVVTGIAAEVVEGENDDRKPRPAGGSCFDGCLVLDNRAVRSIVTLLPWSNSIGAMHRFNQPISAPWYGLYVAALCSSLVQHPAQRRDLHR